MSKYPDAIGYLLALRDDLERGWFTKVCELAISTIDGALLPDELAELAATFVGNEEYLAKPQRQHPTGVIVTPPPAVAHATAIGPTVKLKSLGQFVNFKKLGNTLNVKFDKRITIVFGTNGSGKSSICDAIKALASPSKPERPLSNVRGHYLATPSFEYELSCGSGPVQWTETSGFGLFSSHIRHFDSTVAIGHLTNHIEPQSLKIELSPFRLEVFDYCRSIVDQLRTYMTTAVHEVKQKRTIEVERLLSSFSDVQPALKKCMLAAADNSCDQLRQEYDSFLEPTIEEEEAAKSAELQRDAIGNSMTPEGVAILKANAACRMRVKNSLDYLIALVQRVDASRYNAAIRDLISKQQAQRDLAGSLIPEGVQLTSFTEFLKQAEGMGRQAGLGTPCPYCKRPLDESALSVVGAYRDFLSNQLQDEISALSVFVRKQNEALLSIGTFRLDVDDTSFQLLDEQERVVTEEVVKNVILSTPAPTQELKELDFSNWKYPQDVVKQSLSVQQRIDVDLNAANKAESGLYRLTEEMVRLTGIVETFRYRQSFRAQRYAIWKIVDADSRCRYFEATIENARFPALLKRLTEAGKDAESDLIVAGFEIALDAEYMSLSKRSLQDFGVRLRVRGDQQNVAVEPQIGEVPIRRVLSEGEQKIHSLAMFFCEAVQQPSDIFVFDDPSTSFDYDNIRAFGERLRDLALHYPRSQFIVFTHCWDFFVRIQLILNKVQLDPDVQVVEHCAVAHSYTEDLDKLVLGIEALLATPGILSDDQTVLLSGKLRRYIESILNKRVFNGQRDQFKQKRHSIGSFQECRKLIPLLEREAIDLAGHYATLSTSEHDDVTNNYTNKSKQDFQAIYDDLQAIDAAILTRRP